MFGSSGRLGPMFLPWRGETRLYLNLKEWDGSSAATPLGPEAAALSRFDSLGENCELALAQRHYGEFAILAEAVESADRKSTRLNSSHSSNSYAVFCLKKK